MNVYEFKYAESVDLVDGCNGVYIFNLSNFTDMEHVICSKLRYIPHPAIQRIIGVALVDTDVSYSEFSTIPIYKVGIQSFNVSVQNEMIHRRHIITGKIVSLDVKSKFGVTHRLTFWDNQYGKGLSVKRTTVPLDVGSRFGTTHRLTSWDNYYGSVEYPGGNLIIYDLPMESVYV